ncbi:MAG: alpha/beta hydrolase-fold protein [Aulosira sp. DedQUE10]|nr:alpha/beta hydrolase-fold protein [Aulosira sp. DedQUE10]
MKRQTLLGMIASLTVLGVSFLPVPSQKTTASQPNSKLVNAITQTIHKEFADADLNEIKSVLTGEQKAGGGPGMQDTVFYSEHIKAATAVTEVFGDGQRLTAVIVEYDMPIKNSSLSTTAFTVTGRNIMRVYANARSEKSQVGRDGNFVVIELDTADSNAPTYNAQGPVLRQVSVTVNQTARVQTASGLWYAPTTKPISNTRQMNLIVDDFQQFKFTDPVTGLVLTYNLFIPKNYAPNTKYPMVLFMHDLGVTNINPYTTLVQGLGATVWASSEEQVKHPAFVLAPQYPVALANDSSQTSDYADVTVRLIQDLQKRYSIDGNRLYSTGQSGGCMTAIALNIKHPKLFAASLLVAGQWDATKVAPMAKNKLWIVVSQDDDKAYPGMNAITAELEKHGARVTRAVWDGNTSAAQFKRDVADLLQAGPDSSIYYVAFRQGTVIPPGQSTAGAAGHRNTWRVAYTIEGIRNWLFQQHR